MDTATNPSLLLNLPVEVLDQILKWADQPTLRSLRLVCHITSKIATPHFFERMTLSLDTGRTADDILRGKTRIEDDLPVDERLKLFRQVEAIKSLTEVEFLTSNVQDLKLAAYEVRSMIKFLYEEPIQIDTPEYTPLGVQILQNFICSMKKLKRLRWHITLNNLATDIDFSPIAASVTHLELIPRDNDTNIGFLFRQSTPLMKAFFPAFKVFTNLTHLSLKLYNQDALDTLNYLPRLVSLSFEAIYDLNVTVVDFLAIQKVPFNLRHLVVKSGTLNDPFPSHITQSFLTELQTLRLKCATRVNLTPYPVSIWGSLENYGVQLREVKTLSTSTSILRYLSSYRDTLVTLSVQIPFYQCGSSATKEKCLAQNSEMMNLMGQFWNEAVRNHASTLKKLKIFPGNQHTRSGDGPGKEEQHETAAFLNKHEPWTVGSHIPIAREVLLLCDKLEEIQMGSAGEEGYQELIEILVRTKRARKMTYNLQGYAVRPEMQGWCGTGMINFWSREREMWKRVMAARWNSEDVPDENWQRLEVEFVPLGRIRLIKDEATANISGDYREGNGCQWRLFTTGIGFNL